MQRVFAAILIVLLVSCGGGSDGNTGPPAPVVASVTVLPGTDTIVVLGQVQLSAVAKDSAGHAVAGLTTTWTSSSPSTATVNGSGNVTSVAMGTATITATVSGILGHANVIVAPILVIMPELPSGFAGDTLQLAAKATDLNHDTLSGGPAPAWVSSNQAVATVSAAGVVTTVGQGVATITATISGGAGSTDVMVLAPNVHANREVSYVAEYQSPNGPFPTRLRLVHADGTGVTNITDFPDFVVQYARSPDGARVAVVFATYGGQGRSGLWVMNADGSSPLQLATSGLYPDWSPDGTRIAFRSTGQLFDISLIRPDGTGLTPLHLSLDNSEPRWSPDGRRIAFRRNSNQLLLVNADGSDVRRITMPGGPSVPTGFVWSPDGKILAFSGWLYDPRGVSPFHLPARCDAPAWAPDGQRFVCFDGSGLVTYARDGTGMAPVGIVGTGARWSNDGTKLSYVTASPSGPQSAYVANANGTGALLVSTGSEAITEPPRWRP